MESNLGYRFQCALALPLAHRCHELSLLIEECSFKDVHTLFPLLVENVFGFGHQPGWGLNLVCRHLQPRDFDAVRSFLSPEGAMMRLVEKLMNDVYLKYEFPSYCLPLPVRHNLENSIIPSFYSSKLQISTPGKLPLCLSLNPFEFYIFHLTYFLIGCHNHKAGAWEWSTSFSQSLYSQVIEDYLHYFLPCDGTFPLAAPYFVLSPIKPAFLPHQATNKNVSWSIFGERTSPLQCLFKKPSVARQISSTSLHPKDIGPGELWRTDVFTQTLIEFWLNHYSLEMHRNIFSSSPDKSRSFSSRSGYSANWNSLSDGSLALSFTESFFPSSDHIRLVRMLIKHIHYFANSANVNSVSTFDEFKRAVIPQLLQKKLYNFIKYMFDHWPLDASFRLVLEMWLSYIQPWRYGDINVLYSPSREKVEERDRVISSKWKPFIEENLVFYSVFFRKMIPRLLRVDLSSPKNASMLHRLSKVFAQANLKPLIKEAEELQQDPLIHSVPLSRLTGQNILSKSAVTAGHASIIRQHINDLEGQTFVYVSMFHEDVLTQVLHLLRVIHQTRMTVNQASQASELNQRGMFSSVSRFFGGLFRFGDDAGVSDFEGFGINGARVDQYLEYASAYLITLFQFSPHEISNITLATPGSNLNTLDATEACSDKIDDLSNFSEMTPARRRKLINRQCKPVMKYWGDPDLQPVRSYEFKCLVRAFYRLSTLINDKFALDIQQLYERNDFFGRICRQFVLPPMVCRTFEHCGTPSPIEEKILPPRISLRPLASQQILFYLSIFYLIGWMGSYSLVGLTIFLLFCVILVAVFRAIFASHASQHTNPDLSPRRAT